MINHYHHHHCPTLVIAIFIFVISNWKLTFAALDCFQLNIYPCKCSNEPSGNISNTIISCRGDLSLPHLTYILREELCGRHFHSFRLDASNISYLPSNLFFKVKVKHIRVDSTNISHFTEAGRSAFFGLERSLQVLIMRRCQLIDQLQWEKIGALKSLYLLDLSENVLTTVPSQWFENPPPLLANLYLRANKIIDIGKHAFASMYNLIYVDLSENQILTLQRSSFPFPGNSIGFLLLSYNNLTTLPKDFFVEMYGLRRIYLDSNQLSTLDEETWTLIWGELSTLDLSGNNFKCECDMAWLPKLHKIQHLSGKCTNHPVLGNRELKSLWPWDFNCSITD